MPLCRTRHVPERDRGSAPFPGANAGMGSNRCTSSDANRMFATSRGEGLSNGVVATSMRRRSSRICSSQPRRVYSARTPDSSGSVGTYTRWSDYRPRRSPPRVKHSSNILRAQKLLTRGLVVRALERTNPPINTARERDIRRPVFGRPGTQRRTVTPATQPPLSTTEPTLRRAEHAGTPRHESGLRAGTRGGVQKPCLTAENTARHHTPIPGRA